MRLGTLLNRWKSDSSIAPNVSSWQVIPPRNPQFVDFPQDLSSNLQSLLSSLGIHSFYLHQHLAWKKIQSGQNIVIVTGTASGKTLAYTLPIIQTILDNHSERALFLYPTKALAHDQLSGLDIFPRIKASAYDGDTPQYSRPQIRSSSQIIVSNPDMLHLGILPFHTNWEDFFSNLSFVVIDEMHSYRGVFGSHVANIIRRLKRVAVHYGSNPQFILTSATIGNPLDLAELLISQPVHLISEDYSARGEKHFLIYNPPVVDDRLGLRANMQRECVR
jgi:DEAD/DEAH box helicase domain-containing protein